MSAAHDLFRPNPLKIILAATLILPVFFAIALISGFPSADLVLPAAITLVISYGAASVIDYSVKSRTTKIAIATVAALLSIILGYILVRSMTMVCDPVHDPVHTPEPTAVTTVTTVIPTTGTVPTTPMIFDPVHEPGSVGLAGLGAFVNAPGNPETVSRKLEECLRDLTPEQLQVSGDYPNEVKSDE